MKLSIKVEDLTLMGFDIADCSDIKESIEKVGYKSVDAILVWHGYVICGERRVKALKELDSKINVDCIILDSPEAALAALETTCTHPDTIKRWDEKVAFIKLVSSCGMSACRDLQIMAEQSSPVLKALLTAIIAGNRNKAYENVETLTGIEAKHLGLI